MAIKKNFYAMRLPKVVALSSSSTLFVAAYVDTCKAVWSNLKFVEYN